jgi:hypothetical protein
MVTLLEEDLSLTFKRRDLFVIAEALSYLGGVMHEKAETHLGMARLAEAENALLQSQANVDAGIDPAPVAKEGEPLIHPEDPSKARYADEQTALYTLSTDALNIRQKLLGQVDLGDHLH